MTSYELTRVLLNKGVMARLYYIEYNKLSKRSAVDPFIIEHCMSLALENFFKRKVNVDWTEVRMLLGVDD